MLIACSGVLLWMEIISEFMLKCSSGCRLLLFQNSVFKSTWVHEDRASEVPEEQELYMREIGGGPKLQNLAGKQMWP